MVLNFKICIKDSKIVSGKGVYKWTNSEVYDGMWQDGLKHGYGSWTNNKGDSYIG